MLEVDQSQKIERMEKDTILAFSNQRQHTICIPASVKRAIFDQLQMRGKDRKNAYLWIFSAGVFLLLKPHLSTIIKQREIIVIDKEYMGKDANIKSMILRHCRNAGFNLPTNRIRFVQIGKSSNAHKAAYEVQKEKGRANKRIKTKEFLDLM